MQLRPSLSLLILSAFAEKAGPILGAPNPGSRGRAGQSVRGVAAPVKPREGGPVGRNDPCPCGSGKKFKKCCRE